MRAFVAIPLPEAIVDVLVRVREQVVSADPTWHDEKWVPAQNLHLTLRFLGDVPAEAGPAIAATLEEAVAPLAPFPLLLTRIRAVPSGRARMLWAAFDDPTEGAAPLARAVLAATEPWAAEDDAKPFKPHATLVRARRPRRMAAESIAAAESLLAGAAMAGENAMSVRRVMLVASTLTRGAPVYEEVSSAVLRGV